MQQVPADDYPRARELRMGKKGGGARRALAAARRAALDDGSDDDAGSTGEVAETGPATGTEEVAEKPIAPAKAKDSSAADEGGVDGDDAANEGDGSSARVVETRGQMLQRHKMEMR